MTRWPTIRIAILLAGLCLIVTVAIARLATHNALSEGRDRAEATLRQTVNALDGHLRRFEAIPQLLADRSELRRFLAGPRSAADIAVMNRWLAATNATIDSSDLYLITPDGTTVAASNHDRPDSFIGQNFAYRPYFTQAVAGGSGRFFALGTTSGVRGYYFASPVHGDAGQVTGVVALKIGVDDLESGWRAREYETLVTDPEGIVFMATQPDWRYRGLLPLTPDRVARTTASRRYSDMPLVELDLSTRTEAGFDLMSLTTPDGVRHEYVTTTRAMPQAGWTVHVILDTAPLRAQARLLVAAVVLLMAGALSLGWALVQRRARLAERIAMQAAAQAELERQVAERTADLTAANAELHRMQNDMVQVGKLAALGRMSAALSHEINQPLAAARNYADSAALLIDRGDLPRARENLGHILSLIDRMATIARHLRNVARKPDEKLHPVDLAAVVADALRIAETRLRASDLSVTLDIPADLPPVRGGPVRLQQVIVNLLSNAADAMEGCAGGTIDISARAEGATVLLSVRDHGTGIPASIADRILDPFFTTKAVGSGLGLGLSISYNILKDFGGDLRMSNHPDGGALFEVVLKSAGRRDMAAE
ncbi:two-component sensor histidine kinase [Rhodobacteraceae bacterium HSP-20]|uniref:histidine kinase n=1 Tax=Paragemmobacter amnigenus TaxID=2852097 RepID=A0ABS6J5R8_9RHOB|nr:ATP-binding protein [Rhodobacter amnigenus]MBU9699110.1 two-component sensor histidine kinase [Rhodobacter amnigenus]MBV4390337.1 two-component sensor histidine kinase [Rhodobacter amnigenus]